MSTITDFFTSSNDKDLALEIISQSADIILASEITPADDIGILDSAIPTAAKFTPAISPVFIVDALIGQMVVIQDDNGAAQEFRITDNDAVSFTVDLEADENNNDKSANYTTTVGYTFILWDDEAYIGDTDEPNFNDEDEEKEFKVGVPKRKRRTDLLEKVVSLEMIIRQVKAGIMKNVYNLKDGDSNSEFHVLKQGSNPGSRTRFYVIAQNVNVKGKNQQLKLLWTTLKQNGARVLGGGDDYETVPTMVQVDSLPIGLETEDYYTVRMAV